MFSTINVVSIPSGHRLTVESKGIRDPVASCIVLRDGEIKEFKVENMALTSRLLSYVLQLKRKANLVLEGDQ